MGNMRTVTGLASVDVETSLQPEVARLLAHSDVVAARLYPGEYRRPITCESLANPDSYVFIARLSGTAVGLCVVFDRGDRTVGIKRMIVDEDARGCGVGTALLSKAHMEASKLGAHAALLEVGIHNTEARALYRGAGYKARAPFSPHKASPISLFMARAL
jgi:putative acetyltransferase